MQRLDGLQLDDETPLDQQIEFESAPNPMALVINRHKALAFESQATFRQFHHQAFTIDALKQPWPQVTMYFDRGLTSCWLFYS